jgi:hypothetical protein
MEKSISQSSQWFRKVVLCIAVAVPALGFLLLQVTGSMTVVDASSSVTSVVLVSGDGRRQPLREIRRGHFLGIPRLAGTLQVQCRGGGRATIGYAAAGLHTKLRVNGCASHHEGERPRLPHHFSP